ncbi:MAG TPA: TonB-dependent receptor [Candidatus Limnocylindrales bacterium]|nr:TonB-dependent receptor [Candidatus Limnocylindrales bacterium]
MRSITTCKAHFWLPLAASVLCAGVALAQVAGGGSIQGTVTDPSGAVIPEVQVVATNVATGVETARQSTAAGLYVITPLPAGEYTVKVTASGFQTTTLQKVMVDALSTVSLPVEMKLGAATQEVTVTGAQTMLHTDDATLGGTMQNNVYTALPLAMNGVPRDPTQFIALMPGVAGMSTQVAGPTTESFNGTRGANELYVEGIPLTFPSQQADTRNLAFGVSVEAVDQFQAETNGQKAMYSGQGMQNFVLKSGTNQLHGSAFEYFRNTALDARGFFPKTVPVEHQNEFGGTIGGPIKKDKIFFFGSYSGYYYKTGETPELESIPTIAERTGDFSALPAVIYDPKSQTCVGAVCSKTPFGGNMIPGNQISPVSKSLQSYLPSPTNGNITNNYLASLPESLHNNNTTNKVDANLSAKNRFYFMFSKGRYMTDFTGSLAPNTDSMPLPYTQGRIVQENTTITQIHYTRTLTPALLNDFSFGYSRIFIPIISATAGGGYPVKAGLTGLPKGAASDVFPTVNFSGTNAPNVWAGTNAVAFDQTENVWTMVDNMMWVHGKHAIGFGFQLQRMQDNNMNPDTGTRATFSFSNNETAGFSPTGTLVSTSGNAYAGYLLGALSSASITDNYVTELGSRFHGYSGFIQDDWKISSRLTLNLGLRYDLMGPYHEAYNRTSYLNPLEPNPAAGGRLGALDFAGYGPGTCNCGNVPMNTHYLNFGPRIGLAYKLTDKTVLRSGYGIVYAHQGGTGNNGTGASPGQLGINASASFASSVTGQPAFYWDNGVPAYQKPPFINPGYGAGFTTASPGTASSLNYVPWNIAAKPPYFENWNIGIQREITPNTTASVTYAGSGGHFVLGNGALGYWTNSIPLQYLALGPLLGVQATAANIAAAQAVFPNIALPYPNFSGTIAQMLKPFPQYAGVTYLWGNRGSSSYNSLQLNLNRRFAEGMTFNVNYVFSKELDNLGSNRNPFDGSLDRARGTSDRSHVVAATAVYYLPFGKGHRLGSSNKVASAIVSNWLLSGVFTFSTGAPLTITGSGCTVTGISSTCIASYNPAFSGPVHINGTYGEGNVTGTGAVAYLAKSAFVDPAAYTFGNLPRSAPFGLVAPYLLNEDASLRREMHLKERVKLMVEANMFNITNSVHFGAPGTNIDSANFGQVSTQANLPRKVQFNARITF